MPFVVACLSLTVPKTGRPLTCADSCRVGGVSGTVALVGNRGQFVSGNEYRFGKGENQRTRAHARTAEAGELLDGAWRALGDEAAIRAVLDQVEAAVRDPVERARRTLQELAPRFVQVLAAVATVDARQLAPWVAPVRVRLDAALQALNRAGLKDTVAVEHDFSDRFKDALSAFYGPPAVALDPAPAALPPDPGEPARRRRTPAARDRNQAQPGESPS